METGAIGPRKGTSAPMVMPDSGRRTVTFLRMETEDTGPKMDMFPVMEMGGIGLQRVMSAPMGMEVTGLQATAAAVGFSENKPLLLFTHGLLPLSPQY